MADGLAGAEQVGGQPEAQKVSKEWSNPFSSSATKAQCVSRFARG